MFRSGFQDHSQEDLRLLAPACEHTEPTSRSSIITSQRLPAHGNEAKTTRIAQRGINTKKTRSLVRWKRIHTTNHPEKGEHSISSHLEMSNSHGGYAEHRWCSSKEHQNYCWPHENKKILIAILYCPERFCVSKTSPLGHFSCRCDGPSSKGKPGTG